jgi:predicted unusual protein kinase regulating ubiquinone biosynthesis (AarF/ABC1/UbiB family)
MRRGAPVVGLAARTAGGMVVAALRVNVSGTESSELHARSAERYAELLGLGRSKGALMKAGQMVSFMSLGPAIPSEFQSVYQAALGRLRADAPPMEAELVREVLEADLGRCEDVFA